MSDKSTKSNNAPTISRAAASMVVRAAIDAAIGIAIEAAVAVTDAAGHLVAFERTDGSRFLAVDVAIDKAWTAVSSGMATHIWNAVLTDNPEVAPLSHHPRLLAVGGGYPIVENGQIIGGIGISGGSNVQDQKVAEQALAAIGLAT